MEEINFSKFTFTIFIIILAASSIGCTNSSQKRRSDLEIAQIKGNVTSITDTYWFASEKFGEPTKDSVSWVHKLVFNEYGNVITDTKYDSNNRRFEQTDKKWDGEKLLEVSTYDIKLGSLGLAKQQTFKYDSNNNRLSFLEIDFREDETNTGKYKNNILESIIGAEFTDRYEIIDDNNSYKVIRTWKDGIIDSSYYKYDKLGRLLEVKEFDGRRTTYYYGEHGFADKVDMPGSEETNNYKFDDKGNWIERITYSKEKPFASKIAYIITRKYEYK